MENQLSFVLRVSLKDMILRRLAVRFWNEPDILLLIEKVLTVPENVRDKFSELWLENVNYNNSDEWREIVESRVRHKITKLALPNLLMKQLLLIATPIGLEIKKWKAFHEQYLSWRVNLNSYVKFSAPILAKLCWTPTGKIDYLKTAQKLMLCGMLSIVNRYIIACLYCMEDFIRYFWGKLPKMIKEEFFDETSSTRIRSLDLEFYWPYILNGEQSKLERIVRFSYPYVLLKDSTRQVPSFDVLTLNYSVRQQYSFNLVAFNESAFCGNKVAIEYFFHKLTDKEKEVTSDIAANVAKELNDLRGRVSDGRFPSSSFSDVVCYLLSLMTQEQQIAFYKEKKEKALCWFLQWPWQDLFFEIAEHVWDVLLRENDCDLLMQRVYLHFWQTKYYFPDLFRKFFSRSPMKLRRRFVFRESGGDNRLADFHFILSRSFLESLAFFPEFFKTRDSATIQVVFRNLGPRDRFTLLTLKKNLQLFYNSILRDDWHMVEVCLREARLSEGDRKKLKRLFLEVLKNSDKGEIVWIKRQWKRFSQLLDESGSGSERKRIREEETLSKAKKLCTDK